MVLFNHMENRRQSERHYLVAAVRIKPDKGRGINASAINLSSGGIGVYLHKPLKKGEKFCVTIDYNNKDEKFTTEPMCGFVTWSCKVGTNFAAGIEFNNPVKDSDLPLLQKCLENTVYNI